MARRAQRIFTTEDTEGTEKREGELTVVELGGMRGRAKARPYRVWERAAGCGGGGHQAKEMGRPVRLLPYQASAVAMTVSSWLPGGAL